MLLLVIALTSLLPSLARPGVLQRFDRMISACCLPPRTIEYVSDPRQRVLFRGVAAAARNVQVMSQSDSDSFDHTVSPLSQTFT